MATNIAVCCRFRPAASNELTTAAKRCVKVDAQKGSVALLADAAQLSGEDAASKAGGLSFNFDAVFDSDAQQEFVFDRIAKPSVQDIFAGFNVTLFACQNQPRTQKSRDTHTMMGDGTPSGKGIIPRLVESIFTSIAHASDNIEFTVKLAYIEIYNEKLKDLLTASPNAAAAQQLKIREGPHGVYIENVTEHYLSSYAQTLQLLALGAERRAVSSTLMNSESSRSHSVCIVTIGQTDKLTGSKKGSKLTLTDLAGSEKVQKTGAEGERLNEARSINKSLSALGNVINALSSKQKHVPYRDSKLTRLLSDSLGGNSKTSLIITASPMSFNADETLSTLRFGVRAKLIKNKPAVNAEKSASEYKRMLEVCNEQLRCAEEIIVGLEADVSTLTRFIEGKGMLVPVLSGMSGAGIQVQMRLTGELAKSDKVEEQKESADDAADDEDEADAESAEIDSAAANRVPVEEHKESPILPAGPKPSSKRASQSGTDLSSLPARLALMSTELSELTSERNRLLDALSDREAEMGEQEEIWKTEQELLALEVKRVASELAAQQRDARKWRAEGEGMQKEVELMRKKQELMEKEHAVAIGITKMSTNDMSVARTHIRSAYQLWSRSHAQVCSIESS
ncbi:hypothetical protein MMC34_008452 [Xylographa carneopallida]|nr:hypothetical protein [Xylographa carneopallida]